MNTWGNDNRGSALLITLAIMVLMTIAAILAVRTAQTDVDLSFNQLHTDQSFYIAEAGLAKAYLELTEDNEWTNGFNNVSFDQGTYSVAVIDSSNNTLLFDTIILRSTGSIRDANSNLEALIVPEYWRPFQYAMFGDSAILMENSTCTDSYNSDSGSYATTVELTGGDVASNGELDFINTAVIGGDISCAEEGGIFIDATCTVYGDTSSNIEPYVLETVPDSLYDWAQTVTPGETGMTGTYSYNPTTYALSMAINQTMTLSGGVYYFSSIDIGNNSQLHVAAGEQVIIYLDGDFTVGENASINTLGDAEDFLVFSRGSIFELEESTDIHIAFYGPDTEFSLANSGEYYGSIVSNSATVINAACVHYDRSLAEYRGGKTGIMNMIAWKEI